uniref:Uncharacterized protein n=1 Tax=Anguilla anguilla TaxID=7936 RepID=A0A0E9VL06_ANGAN
MSFPSAIKEIMVLINRHS